jgi:hypothetical protein
LKNVEVCTTDQTKTLFKRRSKIYCFSKKYNGGEYITIPINRLNLGKVHPVDVGSQEGQEDGQDVGLPAAVFRSASGAPRLGPLVFLAHFVLLKQGKGLG